MATQPFLDWLVRRHWGDPPDGRCWPCPHCGHRGFAVRPHKPEHRDRWHCWHCAAWGDECDFIKLVYPGERYPIRLNRLDALREAWEAEGGCGSPESLLAGTGRDGGKTPIDPMVTEGEELLWRLLRAKVIDHNDLLGVTSELNYRNELRLDLAKARAWRERETARAKTPRPKPKGKVAKGQRLKAKG